MKIELGIEEYTKLLEAKKNYETLYNAIYMNMEYVKYTCNDEKITLEPKGILSVIKALDPKVYLEYTKEIINKNEVKEN